MAKKKEKHEEAAIEAHKEDTMTSAPAPRKRKLMHWFLATGVLVAAFVFFANRSGNESAEMPTEPGAVASDAANQDVLAQELNGTPPPPADGMPVDQSVPPSDPQVAAAEEPMPIPEPVTADTAGTPPADGDMSAAPADAEMHTQMAEPEPPPPAATKPSAKKKASAPKAAAKKTAASAKKYTITLNKKGIKVPAALNKAKVTSFLSKKLEGDKTCIPGKLAKKDVKPFNATVSVSKTGSITAVDIKPKLPEAKAITSCLKKKLAGNAAVFKSKSASKITVALKVK